MEKGLSSYTKYILNYMDSDVINGLDDYITSFLNETFYEFKSDEDIIKQLEEYVSTFNDKVSYEEAGVLKDYSGLKFRNINAILRGYWDYDKNGVLTNEVKEDAFMSADKIQKILAKSSNVPFNLKAYRGVNIRTFYSFGISSIEDLIYLNGKFFYDPAFTSTTLLKDKSFYSKQPEWGYKCNIEIEYYIPNDSDDGMFLSEYTSYAPSQKEFLISSSSLFKVFDVEVDKENDRAKLKMFLIPKKLWNRRDYDMEHGDTLKSS